MGEDPKRPHTNHVQPAHDDLARAIADFQAGLRRAFDSAKPASSPVKDAPYERARYVNALKAVSDLIKATSGQKQHMKCFYRLALALEDLNYDIVDPLLKPTLGRTKQHASSTWCARANVALGILALIRSTMARPAGPMKRKEAAKQAARDFAEISKLAGVSRREPTSTETKILSWYDDFMSGKVKNRQATALFNDGRQAIEHLVGDPRLRKVATRMFNLAVNSSLRE
jgi:hypothetical protein